MVLLYLDLLGTRARWVHAGREGVEAACKTFRELILRALAQVGPEHALSGGIESDAAAIVLDDAGAATQTAREVYRAAFLKPSRDDTPRVWLRGAILPASDRPLRSERALSGSFRQLKLAEYSSDLLDAISVEKSGLKGMRLVLADSLVTGALRRRWLVAVRGRAFIPFKKLRYAGYPTRLRESYQDFLWMACGDVEEWGAMQQAMNARLRYAAVDPDEGAQAAVTQVVFHEVAAIRGHLGGPERQRRPSG
jgi:hypothetical protein